MAVIGDVHGHIPALEAAFRSIDTMAVDTVVCLGDLVDGGDDADACIELVRSRCSVCVRGNHDEIHDDPVSAENDAWLQSLSETVEVNGWLLTHFSPRNRSDKIRNSCQAWNAFDDADFQRCCVGHAHVPTLYEYDADMAGDCREVPFVADRAPLAADRRLLYVNPSLAYNRWGLGLMYSLIEDDCIRTVTVDVPPIEGYA